MRPYRRRGQSSTHGRLQLGGTVNAGLLLTMIIDQTGRGHAQDRPYTMTWGQGRGRERTMTLIQGRGRRNMTDIGNREAVREDEVPTTMMMLAMQAMDCDELVTDRLVSVPLYHGTTSPPLD